MAQDFMTSGSAGVPAGAIVMWSGLVNDVPNGWSICDGTNGTPDLRKKFVRGASGEMGAEGGVECHCHSYCGCTGCTSGSCSLVMVNGGCSFPVAGYSHIHSIYVCSGNSSNIPPYYELIFIRKD
jgi:hypothetical protein